MKVIDAPQDFVGSTFILRLRTHNLEDYATKMATCVIIRVSFVGTIVEAMYGTPDAVRRQAETTTSPRHRTCLKLDRRYIIFMKTVTKIAVNPDTGQFYMVDLPGPEVVRQAILELEYPSDGIRVVNATEKLAEKFHLSEHQKRAKNRTDLNVFRYDVVAPQFRRLLRGGQLEQPSGSKMPYFLTENKPDQPSLELRETSPQPEWSSVERTAADPETGEEYQIALPETPVVKQALLDFEYPPSGIHIRGIAEALADQFALTEEQTKAKGKYGLVWKRHVNIAANSLVNSGQLLRIKFGWIINPEQPNIEPSDPNDDSPFSDGDMQSPEVVIDQNHREHQDRLKVELRQKIMDNPPEFFEKLVLDLLVKMGYG